MCDLSIIWMMIHTPMISDAGRRGGVRIEARAAGVQLKQEMGDRCFLHTGSAVTENRRDRPRAHTSGNLHA